MTTLLSIFNKLSDDSLFTYHQALYWYCAENHEGQFTELYSILSTLQYKPSTTEKAEDADFDVLGFPISHENMLLLATALRLYAVVQLASRKDNKFHKLHYFADKDLYLAEYHDVDEDGEGSAFYAVYTVTDSGTTFEQGWSNGYFADNIKENSELARTFCNMQIRTRG